MCLLFLGIGTLCHPVIAEEEEEKTAEEIEAEEKAAEEKAEQERKEAEEKRKAEQAAIKAQFPYTFNDVADKIVTIECTNLEGDKSAGSGFIARMNGRTYIFTNQHVIMGATGITILSATGAKLIPRGVELSLTRDIARLPLADSDAHEGFDISGKPALDMLLAVFGNSEGGGVATELYGEVTGVTADLVEVSAEFVSGNSGSPVLNQNREVIGIASYVRFSAAEQDEDNEEEDDGESKENSRRFCYRLTDVEWVPVNWKRYTKIYGRAYLETEALVESVFDVVNGWSNDPFGYVPSDFRNYDLKRWAKEHNDMVDKIVRLSDKGTATPHELKNINRQISNDIADSAEALSEFCRKKSRHVEMNLSKKELTGFLRDRIEANAGALEYASMEIDEFGEELADIEYFRFRRRSP
jgi:hypothetical protein